jgi:hypothetical protein
MRCDLPYKLKHKETGLYWKGGGIIPFTNSGLETSCWSKNGKSWNMKGHLSSAISNTFHKEYVRTATTDFYDYKSCDETYFPRCYYNSICRIPQRYPTTIQKSSFDD